MSTMWASEIVVRTAAASATRAVGRAVGECLRPGDVVALFGGLGAGKTVFVQGLALGLGVDAALPVTSPTFVLVSEYEGRVTLFHVDAYRLDRPAAFEALGADEMLFGRGVCAIEWADRVAACLPEARLDVTLEVEGENCRRLALVGRGRTWRRRREEMAAALDAARIAG